MKNVQRNFRVLAVQKTKEVSKRFKKVQKGLKEVLKGKEISKKSADINEFRLFENKS